MKFKIFSILLLLFLTSGAGTTLQAQKKARKLRNLAEKAYNEKRYYEAIDYYQEYCMQKPEDTETLYRLASLQYNTRDYRRAKINFKGLYKNDPERYELALFYHALSAKQLGEYELATSAFNEFLGEYKGKDTDRDTKKRAKLELEGCSLATNLLDSALKVVVVHGDTSINKAYNEFSPVQINDSTLLYATLRSDTLLKQVDEGQKRFYTAKKKDREWQFDGPLEGPFNSDKHTTGNGVYSASGKRFYFTRCTKLGNGLPKCDLYQSLLEEGQWQEPFKIGNGVNSFDYTTTQPAVAVFSKTSGKEVIYFVSDRPGGKGGFDIWYTIYDVFDKSFLEPRNAGRAINTVGDEFTPFFDERNRTLYFSSNGHPGMGGFDVFRTQGEKRRWTEAQNIGYPLNSSFDDLYFSVYNKKQGFVVSNRDGGIAFEGQNCCDDIYSYYWTEFIDLSLTGKIIESENADTLAGQAIGGATVNLILTRPGTDEHIPILTKFSHDNGAFFFDLEPGKNYALLVTKEGYFSRQIEISAVGVNYSDTLNHTIELGKIPEKPIVIEHVYFAYGSEVLSDTAKRALDNYLIRLMKENPKIKLEIFAHTDSRGDAKYNQKLSQRRAQSIVDYMTKQGISRRRLDARGFGETRPIAPNEHPDGSDNPEGRRLNRRIELNVVK